VVDVLAVLGGVPAAGFPLDGKRLFGKTAEQHIEPFF